MNSSVSAAHSPVLAPVSSDVRAASRSWWRRRWLRRLMLLATVVAIGVALRMSFFTPYAVPVTMTRAETGIVEELVTNNKAGTVTARLRATLTPEIGGVIVRVPVKEGDRVTRGQPLLELSDTELRAQLNLQERSREVVQATVTQT